MTRKRRKKVPCRIILRRNNGRTVKIETRESFYAAKILRDKWEEKYDDSYYVDIERA